MLMLVTPSWSLIGAIIQQPYAQVHAYILLLAATSIAPLCCII
jgi:hypothetical protein